MTLAHTKRTSALDRALQAVNDRLLTAVNSSVPLLNEASQYVLGAGGKRLRPRLVLLAYEAAGGQEIESVIPVATAVEIIHTATLVHDDINDQGTLRRGQETVNARWGRTFALLTGDFMFTKASELMFPYGSDLNAILMKAAVEMVEGETLQILASEAKTLDQPLYFQIIAKKTASLFSAAAALGATAAGAPPEWLDALHQYALHLGLAFQVIDDVLDLAADSLQLGKNAGIDIVQGRGIAVALMGNGHRMDFQDGQFLEEVIRKGREKAYEWAARAVAGLCGLPPSPARDELAELAVQIVERDR